MAAPWRWATAPPSPSPPAAPTAIRSRWRAIRPSMWRRGQTVTQNAVIADGATPGEVEKTGGGTLVLTAANTYTGGTTIDAGTLRLGVRVAAWHPSGALIVNGGVFDIENGGQTVGPSPAAAATSFSATATSRRPMAADTSFVRQRRRRRHADQERERNADPRGGSTAIRAARDVTAGTLSISSDHQSRQWRHGGAGERHHPRPHPSPGTYGHAITVTGDSSVRPHRAGSSP